MKLFKANLIFPFHLYLCLKEVWFLLELIFIYLFLNTLQLEFNLKSISQYLKLIVFILQVEYSKSLMSWHIQYFYKYQSLFTAKLNYIIMMSILIYYLLIRFCYYIYAYLSIWYYNIKYQMVCFCVDLIYPWFTWSKNNNFKFNY